MEHVPFIHPGEEKRYLAEHGVRPLNHRVAVFRYLLENPIHPSADEIYEGLKHRMASISRTTVYNVLNLLSDRHIIKRISIDTNELRYDANTNSHIHFRCDGCHHVIDMHDLAFPEIELPVDYRMQEAQININGTCPACR
ncbi:MAG: Fur family transcriptional regulator [Sphaerochaetaceae bacterium]